MNTKIYKRGWNLLVVLIVLIIAGSCQKFADPALVFEEEPDVVVQKARKVLIISVDGLSGIELEKYVPQNIQKLLEHSKYTFSGMADAQTGDASTWATMLSGKSSANHGVHGNSFEEEIDEDDPHGHNSSGGATGYVTFFLRLLEQGKNLKSFSATSWTELDENVMAYADTRILKSNDEEVKMIAIDTLKTNNISFGVINFRDVNDAGVAGGFSLDNPAYKAAIDKVDSYIGEIRNAIESRSNFENEDWMIIVTANHAGTGNEYGGASFEERKVPIILYNANFVGQEFETPELAQFARLSGSWSAPVRALVPAEKATAFNFGTTGEYTVQLKMNLKSRGSSWPGFFGKKATTENTNARPGWAFMLYDPAESPKWRPFIGHQTSGPVSQLSNLQLQLEEWTTLTMKIYEADGKRYVRGFTNDNVHTDFEITGRDLNNNEPLILGGMPGWISTTPTFDVSDIRIYNTALSDEYIKNTYCQDGTTASDTYYSNLIAYWPIKEGVGNLLKDIVGNADFVFERPTSWMISSPNFCNIPLNEDDARNQVLVYSIDILPQIAYWMGVTPQDSWALEGKLFLDRYEAEFLK